MLSVTRESADMSGEGPHDQQEPRRRVSIACDATHGLHGYTNEGFEPRRRVSVASDHVSDGRRKSILHSPDSVSVASHHTHHEENGKPPFSGEQTPVKKYSMSESVQEKGRTGDADRAWWISLCTKCHQAESETVPSWSPPLWGRLCPCPYRKAARLVALLLVGLLAWGVVYCVLGADAAPGGQLFGLALLCIAAHFGGWLVTLTTLPALIGMLMVGVVFQNVGLVHVHGGYHEVVAVLRRIALVIILTRAGLDLDPAALRRLRVTVLKLGLIPWGVECGVVAIMTHYLLDLPWVWGFLLGSVIAAVSPAVVVPCLFRLRAKGYGVAKGIPTLIIAVAGIDDATSVAIFGVIHSVMFSTDSLLYQIFQGPLSIIGGVAFGVFWGVLCKYVPGKDDPFVVPLRILLLFGGGLIAVFGSESLGWGGAGPLGVITGAFVACYYWSQQGWEVEDNPVATAFEVLWMLFEPILFGLTGTQVRVGELDGHVVTLGVACLVSGIVIRIAVTVLVAIGCKLNLKEKIFVALSWMAKATVQAALGPVTLDSVRESPTQSPTSTQHAQTVLMTCVLSILLTAPVGAVLITLSGPRLLKKTTAPPVEGWRRSARPSLRDISIIDEEDDGDDDDDDGEDAT